MPQPRTAQPDRHLAEYARVNMGTDQSMRARLDQPIRKQLDALYKRLYGGKKAAHRKTPTFAKFVGYCLALGIDQLSRQSGHW